MVDAAVAAQLKRFRRRRMAQEPRKSQQERGGCGRLSGMPRSPARGNGAPRATLRSLAEHLRLSPASISLVLNKAPGARAIPHATQQRILQAARRFQYRPNTLARSLRHKRSFTIGVMVPEVSEGYAAMVMSGIEDQLLQEGYLYFITSHRHRPDLIDEYPKLMLERAVEGLILVDTPWRRAFDIPVVAVSGHGRAPGVSNIVIDHECAARAALTHLYELGHRQIAVIKGQSFSSDTVPRWRAIQAAATRLGLSIDPRLVVALEGNSPWPDLGHVAARKLLASGRRFTALFSFNDISAIGAIGGLRESGLRVPEDVSVLGFDDIQSAAFQNPGLTTVRQPLRDMGALAAETLVRRIEQGAGDRGHRTIKVSPELVVRGTTRALA
jgi:LacI family transcriptional regulator